MNEELRMNKEEILHFIDTLNKNSFEYVGIMHLSSGCREIVESHIKFIDDLGVEPIKKIEVCLPLDFYNDEKIRQFDLIFVTEIRGVYVYKLCDLKNKLENEMFSKFTKHRCILTLGGAQ